MLASVTVSSLPRCGCLRSRERFDFRMAFDFAGISGTPYQSGLLQISYYVPGYHGKVNNPMESVMSLVARRNEMFDKPRVN